MGSPLSSVVADFFMEAFKQDMLNAASLKPSFYRCYVDDTLFVWTHDHDALTTFVNFLNCHKKIQITMELEHDRTLPCLDILLLKK